MSLLVLVLEAMAAGAPVVVSDTGGMAEIVKNEFTGLKVARVIKVLSQKFNQTITKPRVGERLKLMA